jgi:Skp family chaperone for outer membrane proteins
MSKGFRTMNPLILVVVGISMATGPMQKSVKSAAPPFGTTRVAVVNIGKVFNQYERATVFKADLEKTLKPFKDDAKRINKNIASWEDSLAIEDLDAASKTRYKEKIIHAKRQLEDMGQQIQKDLGTRQEENLVMLWKEVMMGISAVATDRKIDVVFGYGDPIEKELLDLFPNVNRKMQAMDVGSTVPLFANRRVDISDEVVRVLNDRAKKLPPRQKW